jgi:outer membrane receptor protein involved in Fe transport
MNKFLFIIFIFTCFSSYAEEQKTKLDEYQVTATKLDNSRSRLSTKTGGSSYIFTKEDIENLPQGQITSPNQILLRAPSVTQNSSGDFHIRGDHSNVQYRINGVIIPEAISGFGNSLDTHFFESVELLTGALPAQYGYRTGGVIDIKTRNGSSSQNRSELTYGGNDTFIANQQFSGLKDKLSYYFSGTYLQNSMGIESPTRGKKSIHNDTYQDRFFGYFSYLLDKSSRLNFIVGNSNNRNQIPNVENQEAQYQLNGFSGYDSKKLNQKQFDKTSYTVASLQGISSNEIDYQISAFSRYSKLGYRSDYAGNLIFDGVASDLDQTSFANGTQGDFSYDVDDENKLRFGFQASQDQVKSYKNNFVFTVDNNGDQNSNDPINIQDSSQKTVKLYGVYLQNEWKPVEKLTVNYGTRYDISKAYVEASQFSPRFGTVYELSKDTKLHAGYAKYFTPPTSEVLSPNTVSKFNQTTNQSTDTNSGKVKPETSDYYDVGIFHQFTKSLSLNFDSYYKNVKNLLDSGTFGNSTMQTPFNYQRGKIYGAELSVNYREGNFASYINFAALRAKAKRIVSNQYLFDETELSLANGRYLSMDHEQRFTGSGGISYLHQKSRYSLDAIYGNGLRRGDGNQNKMSAYWQFNAAIAKDFYLPTIEKVNARLSVINILDKSYKINDGSGIGYNASRFGPRRTFYLTMSKNF